uniref:Uncharacterized protein n=1 Tax=Chromera velia CCMP2878 TaxID=1169474 RepID=A0A0G4ICB1_9ALVE|eukprot:Cvel_2240.t1-p1 / transcript=Cvel_2240.t1 / gene=Cvel_2240 / organism=Chromera_velia_CCMP2878 / gene_product=Zinc finger protein 571, putative / transcript_product=Zinc finger protein 571, putative / location=Cvel_scaffold86:72958-73521(-) / protein_length=188 / sequence_SO=supercontig / SO=protein_coding / is_pseudo=false
MREKWALQKGEEREATELSWLETLVRKTPPEKEACVPTGKGGMTVENAAATGFVNTVAVEGSAKSAVDHSTVSMVVFEGNVKIVGGRRSVNMVAIDQHAKNAAVHKSASMAAFEDCVKSAGGVEFVSTVARDPTVGIVEEVRFVNTTSAEVTVESARRTTLPLQRCCNGRGTSKACGTEKTPSFESPK